MAQPLLCTIALRHHSKSNIAASHDIMLLNKCFSIIEDSIRITVCQCNLKTIRIADFSNLFWLKILSYCGNLDSLIAHFCNFFHRACKILYILSIRFNRIKLCTCFHNKSPFSFYFLLVFIKFISFFLGFCVYYTSFNQKNPLQKGNKTLHI